MIRLRTIWRQWRAESILFCLLLAFAGAVVLTAAVYRWVGWPVWVGVFLFAGCMVGALMVFPVWRMKVGDVASYLDRQLPELEESCGLLLRPVEELGMLERLQVVRVEKRLLSAEAPRPMRFRLLVAAGLLGLAGMAAFVIGWTSGGDVRGVAVVKKNEVVPVGIRSVAVRITPPAYTGRVVRSQDNFSLEVEEGAQVQWEVETRGLVDTVAFIFNDTAVQLLRRDDGGKWSFAGVALRGGFYQVRIGGQLSELYRFEVIKDEPPKVRVIRPKGYTMIDYGEPTKVPLQVELSDDYGIAGSAIFATVSSGKGEAVKFKQQELRWGVAVMGGKNYSLSRVFDLVGLGLKPGDELYFYCQARDNHGQETRSDMYIIALADTAQLMSLEGMTLPTDVKPEFFRSERQIIIETEQLLRAKDTIAVQGFKDKSNDLGIDQKLLRLRYGKFLGEEAEEGDERGGVSGDTTTFGNFGESSRILEVYTDKHDNAEDATFLEPVVKSQLRATLSEMWKAELQFRINKPKEALPFCYKALRLLKDLQQQSRAYVAKTGVRLTPLNPAKRLTGELGSIAAPVERAERYSGLTEEEVLRMGLAVLEGMRVGLWPGRDAAVLGAGDRAVLGTGDRVVLEQVERRLAKEAAARPGKFLVGYEGMKRLSRWEDITAAERAIVGLLPVAKERPMARPGVVDGGLAKIYFGLLK